MSVKKERKNRIRKEKRSCYVEKLRETREKVLVGMKWPSFESGNLVFGKQFRKINF